MPVPFLSTVYTVLSATVFSIYSYRMHRKIFVTFSLIKRDHTNYLYSRIFNICLSFATKICNYFDKNNTHVYCL